MRLSVPREISIAPRDGLQVKERHAQQSEEMKRHDSEDHQHTAKKDGEADALRRG